MASALVLKNRKNSEVMPLIRHCYLVVMAAVFSLLFSCFLGSSQRRKDNDYNE
jgi:hypothetical protein